MLVGDQIAPVLTGVGILSHQPAHQRLGRLTLGLHPGVIAAALVLAFDDPMHPVGVQGYEVGEVAVFRVVVHERLVLRMQAMPPHDPRRRVEQASKLVFAGEGVEGLLGE